MNFIGEYKAKVDDKGRMVFPAAFKAVCGQDLSRGFIVRKSLFANCLEMYTYQSWSEQSEAVRAKLNLFNREHDRFWRAYTSECAFVVPDEKLGRISIPKELMDWAGLDHEVVFCGRAFMVEIWAKGNLDGSRTPQDEYVTLAQAILG